ncbi:hypothetical protein AHAS_Ahas18G0259100 [Arachis hypogaea]
MHMFFINLVKIFTLHPILLFTKEILFNQSYFMILEQSFARAEKEYIFPAEVQQLQNVPLGSGGSDWDFDPLFSTSPYCIRKFRWGTFGMGSGLPETRNSMENNINNVKTQSDHWPGY